MALNLDVPKTAAIVLGAWPKLLALRDQVARLPDFEMNRFDKLRDYAWALVQAHSSYREHAAAPDNRAELRLMRQRAFTLLVSSYDEARRAVSFLRWHEQDLESIAPSLWSGRGARPQPKPASSSADVEQPETDA